MERLIYACNKETQNKKMPAMHVVWRVLDSFHLLIRDINNYLIIRPAHSSACPAIYAKLNVNFCLAYFCASLFAVAVMTSPLIKHCVYNQARIRSLTQLRKMSKSHVMRSVEVNFCVHSQALWFRQRQTNKARYICVCSFLALK